MFSAKWWACMYGAPTAKRHIGWSNCKTIKCLDLGRMVRKLHTKKGGLKSTKTYRNKEGKKSFAGNQHLKGTGTPGLTSSFFCFPSELPPICLHFIELWHIHKCPPMCGYNGFFWPYEVYIEYMHMMHMHVWIIPLHVFHRPGW